MGRGNRAQEAPFETRELRRGSRVRPGSLIARGQSLLARDCVSEVGTTNAQKLVREREMVSQTNGYTKLIDGTENESLVNLDRAFSDRDRTEN